MISQYYEILSYIYTIFFIIILIVFIYNNRKKSFLLKKINTEIKKKQEELNFISEDLKAKKDTNKIIQIEINNIKIQKQNEINLLDQELINKKEEFKIKIHKQKKAFEMIDAEIKKKQEELNFISENLKSKKENIQSIQVKINNIKNIKQSEVNSLEQKLKIKNDQKEKIINEIKTMEEQIRKIDLIKKVKLDEKVKLEKNLYILNTKLIELPLEIINSLEVILNNLESEEINIKNKIDSFCKVISNMNISTKFNELFNDRFSNSILKDFKDYPIKNCPKYDKKYIESFLDKVIESYLSKQFDIDINLNNQIKATYIYLIKKDKGNILSDNLKNNLSHKMEFSLNKALFLEDFEKKNKLVKEEIIKKIAPNIGFLTSRSKINNNIIELYNIVKYDFTYSINITLNNLSDVYKKYCEDTILKEKKSKINKIKRKIESYIQEDSKESLKNKKEILNKDFEILSIKIAECNNEINIIDTKYKLNELNKSFIILKTEKEKVINEIKMIEEEIKNIKETHKLDKIHN